MFELLAKPLAAMGVLGGMGIDDVMPDFGSISRQLADHPSARWLGPHKGVVHLALASLTDAFFDLWAKSRGVPLWKLLLDLSPEEVVRTLDLSYVEEVDRRADTPRRHIRPCRAGARDRPHEVYFLEHIPHLKEHFVFPAQARGGFYETPMEPGASTDMILADSGGR